MRSFILPPLAGEVRRSRIGGGERSEPVSRMLIMPYDTESQSRNVLASPLGEEGHEVAKGCTRVRMIMILDVDVTAAGGIIKLIALRAIPQPSGQRPVKLKNPPANGRSILRTFPWCPPPWSSASAPPKEPHYFLSKNFTISWGISFFRSMAGRSPWSRYFSFSERRVSM